jgi:hypothetical protein
MLVLQIYLVLSYIGGTIFSIMTLSEARMLSVADILMLILSPFCVMPILMVQLLSQFVDVDQPLIKL